MEASPWAAVVFMVVGISMFGAGFTDPKLIAVYFVAFAVLWVAGGYVRDWIRFRGKS